MMTKQNAAQASAYFTAAASTLLVSLSALSPILSLNIIIVVLIMVLLLSKRQGRLAGSRSRPG
jgi:hypothetical protein